MKRFLLSTLAYLALGMLGGCANIVTTKAADTAIALTPVSETEPIVLPSSSGDGISTARWAEATHVNLSSIAASQWGLSVARVLAIADASDYPDTYQAGFDNGYNQQWSHAYIYDKTFSATYYLWGDADEDFHDNLLGPVGGEGYQGYYAGYFYGQGKQQQGDQYLGYAMHYIEDVSLTLHSTAPTSIGLTVPYKTTDMLTHHFDFEAWVANNLTGGWRLLDAVNADHSYYVISDTKQAIRNAAWASCSYQGTSSVGYSAWKAYRDCGYPTGAGTGNAALVDNTKKMLIAAGRYAKGAIKFTLDNNAAWTSLY